MVQDYLEEHVVNYATAGFQVYVDDIYFRLTTNSLRRTNPSSVWSHWQLNRTYNDEDDYQGYMQPHDGAGSTDSSSEEEGR